RELYLEESHQWIQTKQRPQYDDNDPDVVMQGEGDKDVMDIDDDFETEFDKRMTMSLDDEKSKKYQFPFDDVSVGFNDAKKYHSDEQNMKGLKFHYTYGGEVQTEGEAAASTCSESIKPLLDHIIKDSLDYNTINLSTRSKRVLIVDYSDLSRQTLVKLVEGSVERINAFGSCEECITTVKAWREQYHDEALYDIVFFNVRENISEEIKNSAKELRRVFDDNLCIVLIVFWSANGRALGQNLVQEIGDFVSEPYAPTIQNEYYSSVKPLADLRIENFYRTNRPPFSDETVKESSNLEKSPMVVSEETAKSSIEVIRKEDLPAVNVPGTEPLVKGKGKNVETAQSENTTTPTDDRASKFRFRPVSKSKCILCV
ncbi:2531_t:CDS:2, partial [Racocetra fulgida]